MKKPIPTPMKALVLPLVLLVLSHVAQAQALIRWDFEVGGQPTLSPTHIGDPSLTVNPVAYSNFYPPVGGYFVPGVSGGPLDWGSSVYNWLPDSSVHSYQNWIEFRFFLDSGSYLRIDSLVLWYKRNLFGPTRLEFRNHKDNYGSASSPLHLSVADTSWNRWVMTNELFIVEGFEQVTFRIYGDGAASDTQGILTTDSVAIYGQVYPRKELVVRSLLSGPWNGLDMNDDLRVAGLVPLEDPYGFGKTLEPEVLSISGPDAIVDWVILSLRSPSDSGAVVAAAPFLLQRDGDVAGIDGTSLPAFGVPEGEYYVSIDHRNHLSIMSAFPIADSVDFADPETPVFGTDSRAEDAGVALLWPGDVDGDGVVRYVGEGNDRDPILFSVGGSVPTNTITGYFPEDVNMDGVVRYVGEDNDRDPILLTIGGSVPTLVRVEQVP